jgi:hypothetical protein
MRGLVGWPFAALGLVAACSGSHGASVDGTASGDGGGADATGAFDAAPPEADARGAPGLDATTPPGDGATRAPCTTSFVGTALTGGYGRLDGELVAVVPANGPRGCRADSGHLHLQVKVAAVVYDVAVNLDTYLAQKDVALPDGAWSEGWHPGVRLDYPTTLGLHSLDFPATTGSALEAAIESALASAAEVAIFATPYDPTGAHDVHRRGGGYDGAIFVNPPGSPAHVLAFRFAADTF